MLLVVAVREGLGPPKEKNMSGIISAEAQVEPLARFAARETYGDDARSELSETAINDRLAIVTFPDGRAISYPISCRGLAQKAWAVQAEFNKYILMTLACERSDKLTYAVRLSVAFIRPTLTSDRRRIRHCLEGAIGSLREARQVSHHTQTTLLKYEFQLVERVEAKEATRS